MTSWTAKKGNGGNKTQINVTSSKPSPGTQARLDSDPEAKKKYDELTNQLHTLLHGLPP